MTSREAAEALSCSHSHVRWMIRHGHLKARKEELKGPSGKVYGYQYVVNKSEVKRIQDNVPVLGRRLYHRERRQ